MVSQYQAKHGRKPERIVVTPYAAIALALESGGTGGVSSACEGVTIVSKEFDEDTVCQKEGDVARSLGVFVRNRCLVSCDLKTV